MDISWNWLRDYVDTDTPLNKAVRLMTMSGLNVDAVDERPGGDALLDVEVTNNRPDCLSHLGVARELAALTGAELRVPEADYEEAGPAVEELTSVEIDDLLDCPRYTARVIRNVKVGPSPQWLVERLEAVGLRPVNNVVDVTNFVLLEHGQPLHAFDYNTLKENRIVVRRARAGETLTAIDHTEHRLSEQDLVIADARRPVALAGVMGGADTEVGEATTDVLLESAMFAPLLVRTSSRSHQLMSDASYRFERGVDWDGIEWASRRAMRLILALAGGEAACGAIDVKAARPKPVQLTLRYDQLPRVLGIDVPGPEVCRILEALGMEVVGRRDDRVEVAPPGFRRDLTREIDLVEEVARVYGYDRVASLDQVPTEASRANPRERVTRLVQDLLVSAGCQETITNTLTDAETASLFSGGAEAMRTHDTAATGVAAIRCSIVPGLLGAKRVNQDAGRAEVRFFEIARAFRPRAGGELPEESTRLALLIDDGPDAGKGTLELLAERLGIGDRLGFEPSGRVAELDAEWRAEVMLDGRAIGFCGLLARPLAEKHKFRRVPWLAEVELDPLVEAADLDRRFEPFPQYPAAERDLALVIDEATLWRDLVACIREAGVAELEAVEYLSVYRGEQIPEGRKCVALRLRFRSETGTLTGEQADAFQEKVLAMARKRLGGELRGGA